MEWPCWLPGNIGARCWRAFGAAAAGLALALAVALPPTALAAQMQTSAYTDVAASNPYASAIGFLTAEGVLNGYGDHTFRPDQPITRAEFTKAVVALLGPTATAASGALADQQPNFADGTNIPSWSWGYINYAQGRGLIAGYPDHTFRANNDVTMVEAATILIRAVADQAAVPQGAWPTNYTIASYDLNLTAGLTFVANQPATRGQTAQMLYDAALLAPTLQSGYASGIPTGVPLYLGGNGFRRSVWQGTLSAVSDSSLTLSDSQGHTVVTAGLTDPFYLFGASDIVQTQGLQATVAEDPQGQVNFVSVEQGSAATVATLATSSVALPTGYFGSGQPFLVTSAGGTADLLLSDGTVIALASTTSSPQGTEYYVNTPTAGLSADGHAAVAGATSLQPGATVSVTMNSSGEAVAVYEVETDVPLGVVTAIDTSSGTLSYTTGANDQTAGTAIIQPWTTVTLNGSVSNAQALAKGDVVAIQFVGGSASGDVNARSVAATQVVVSGEIQSLQTLTNGTTTSHTIGLVESNGQTRSITEDAEFDAGGASIQVGVNVSLALDSQGQARQAQAEASQQFVALVEGTQKQTTQGANGPVTTTQVVVDRGGQHEVYDVATGVNLPVPGPTGYLAVLTFSPGTTTVSGVTQLQQVTQFGSLSVLSDDGNLIVVQPTATAGNGGTALVLTKSAGAVVYNGETFEQFGSLTAGQAVTVWAEPGGPDLGVLIQ